MRLHVSLWLDQAVNTPFLVLSNFLKTAMIHKEIVKSDSPPKTRHYNLSYSPSICPFSSAARAEKYSIENDVTYPSFGDERQRAAELEGERDGGEEFWPEWIFTLLGKGGVWNGFIREPRGDVTCSQRLLNSRSILLCMGKPPGRVIHHSQQFLVGSLDISNSSEQYQRKKMLHMKSSRYWCWRSSEQQIFDNLINTCSNLRRSIASYGNHDSFKAWRLPEISVR